MTTKVFITRRYAKELVHAFIEPIRIDEPLGTDVPFEQCRLTIDAFTGESQVCKHNCQAVWGQT
jgi:hypothetical protein